MKIDIPITDDVIAEIEARHKKAESIVEDFYATEFAISASLNDIPALCATVRALRERLNEETQYASELRHRLVIADGVYNEKGEYTQYAQTAINRATDQLQSQLEQVTKERDEERRLRAELKQIAHAGFDNISSLGTTLKENAVIDFRSRAIALCREKAAEYETAYPETAHALQAVAGKLEGLK
jgi:DNA repair exonuclease SbcCD ATPase subunit